MAGLKENDMKNYMLKYLKGSLFIVVCFVLGLASCAKDDYYRDGGKAEAKFNGDILQFLESKPREFDSVVQIIKIAGLEDVFKKEKITFFAPNDRVIKETIKSLNPYLYAVYKDTIKNFNDINPEIWRKFMLRYVFKGEIKLADVPQIDLAVLPIYPGQNYLSYEGAVYNMGVIYNEANGVKYMGYRQLILSYVPDVSKPKDNWIVNYMSSSDIQPNNGVVHTLIYNGAPFGIDYSAFVNAVVRSK